MKILKKYKHLFLIVLFLLICVCGSIVYNGVNKKYIDRILSSRAYAYLPNEAKDYIKTTYESTGEVILTEKNKKENQLYLNPDYVDYLMMEESEKQDIEEIPTTLIMDYVLVEGETSNEYPSYYNLSDINGKSFVTPIKNQGSLGLCWAHGAIEQAESYLLVKDGTGYESGVSDVFSVRQLDYATSLFSINNYLNPAGIQHGIGTAGNYWYAIVAMANGLSLVDEAYMPYSNDKSMREMSEILNYDLSKYELNSSVFISAVNSKSSSAAKEQHKNILKKLVVEDGGAYISVKQPQGKCEFLNTDGKYTIVNNGVCDSATHAMQLVGWDDNYNYSYCKGDNKNYSVNSSGKCNVGELVNGQGAWIIRNSWGNTRSYVYYGYDSEGEDIYASTNLSKMSDRNWDNNYFYNPIVHGSYYASMRTNQVFNKKNSKPEKLQKVKFISGTVNGNYTISVKSGNKWYNDIATVETEFPGLVTVDLSDKNIVLDDDKFVVRVNGNNSSIYLYSIFAFTSNIDENVFISTSDLRGEYIEKDSNNDYKFVVYSETKNIDSNEVLNYSLFKDNTNYSNYIEKVEFNNVATNNSNSTITIDGSIPSGNYKLVTAYNGVTSTSTVVVPSNTQLVGSGTMDDPYLIYNEVQLNAIRNNLNAYYKLKKDIVLSNEWIPIGTKNNPFRGGLDGDNHTISNLFINSETYDSVGLFGYVKPKYDYEIIKYDNNGDIVNDEIYEEGSSYIKNLYVKNADVTNKGSAGILVGNLIYSTLPFKIDQKVNTLPSFSIDNVHIIGGSVKSVDYDAGSVLGELSEVSAFIKISGSPILTMNNVFSSASISGGRSAGMIGFIVDNYLPFSNNKVSVELSNFQNAGIVDNRGLSYSDTNYFSPVLGGMFGNASVKIKTNIINSTFKDSTYMASFVNNHIDNYYVGYYDTDFSNSYNFVFNSGYFVTKYPCSSNMFVTAEYLKRLNLINWPNFSTYWKTGEINNIDRIPVLKNVDFQYTDVSNINVEKDEYVSLKDSIAGISDINYVDYEFVDNNNIISIDYVSNNGIYLDDIIIKGNNLGDAYIIVKNNYDGLVKQIKVSVTVDEEISPVITYHYDGNSDSESYTQVVEKGQRFNLINNRFSKVGYYFDGWTTFPDGTGTNYRNGQSVRGIDSSMHLYAKWVKKRYNIRFNSNGGTGTMEDMLNVNIDDDSYVFLNTNTYVREGYTFSNWTTEADGSGDVYIDSGELTFGEADQLDDNELVLYANWVPNRYSFSLHPNNGDSDDENDMFVFWVNYDEEFKLYSSPYRNGDLKLLRWNTKPDGTGKSYSSNQNVKNLTSVNGDNVVLYAIWGPNYEYSVNKYNIDNNKKIIYSIPPDTDADTYLSNIFVDNGYSYAIDSKEKQEKRLIYTGGSLKLYIDNNLDVELFNAVSGDLNADGQVTSIDLLILKRFLLNMMEFDDVYRFAADINADNKINSNDLLRIRYHLLGVNKIGG